METRSASAPIRRQDYSPFAWQVQKTDLTVQIFDDHARVAVTMTLQSASNTQSGEPLFLNGKALTFVSAETTAGLLPDACVDLRDDGLVITGLHSGDRLTVTSICDPFTNTALEGLYASGDMICTQCEPEGFRRICYYPDRPDVMSIFTTRIEAPERYQELLSNGNLIETGSCEEGRHYALWHDPHPKPAYLFALVAGILERVEDSFTTLSGKQVALHILVEPGNGHLTGHAMDSLKRSMKWDEDVYGLEYDLDLFQIVAVSHFNMGAMENKGLNIFNSKFVLADKRTATDTDLDNVEAIIAHEYFHNWTGNRVTCRDWFQLTLKEGLTVFRDQSFSADTHDEGVKRAADVAALRAVQFPEDASPTAHPIRPETYSEINNFYTPTIYEKGAEIIRMMHRMLGADGFRAGMDLYFARHDGQAVTCDDFVAAMADANNRDLSAFQRWYSQAGTPTVSVNRSVKNKSLMLNLTQALPETAAKTLRLPQPIPMSLAFFAADGSQLSFSIDGAAAGIEQVYLLSDAEATITLEASDGDITKAVPSLLRGFSAPVRLVTDISRAELCHLIAHDTDPFNRYEAVQSLFQHNITARLNGKADETGERQLADALISLLQDVSLRDDFKALALGLPSQADIEQQNRPADPPAIWQARNDVQATLGRLLISEIADRLAAPAQLETAAQRSLQNRLLLLGCAAEDTASLGIAATQANIDVMSLSMGALAALNSLHCPERDAALSAFHDKWSEEPLVLEKWFALEAGSPIGGTVERLATLMEHRQFDVNNPNKIRSVLGVFAAANPRQFHKDDGSGYQFIASQLAILDKRNPQIAARLGLTLTRFQHYAPARQALMQDALTVLSKNTLSADLSEVVNKAVAG